MGWRVCSVSRCPEIHDGTGKCPECRAEADARRGSRQSRGYDAQYDRARAEALAGATHCVTCREPFTEDSPATGGHAKAIRDGGTVEDGIVPECQRCNYGWRRTASG